MNVTVYTLPSCVQCDATKRMLTSENVEFEVVDLTKDVEAATMVASLGYKSAPVIVTDKEHWSGFRYEKIQHLASLAKLEKVNA